MASSEKPQSKFTEVQGIKLHYLEWGETGKAISCWCMVGPALHPDGQPSGNIFAAASHHRAGPARPRHESGEAGGNTTRRWSRGS